MIPAVTENKQEPKNEQVQVEQPAKQEVAANKEATPDIKSEENKANWKMFREQSEARRKALEEEKRQRAEEKARADALAAALEASLRPQHQQHQHSYQSDGGETEEQRLDRLVEEKLKAREAEYERQRIAREQQEAPNRILQAYPDFAQVVTNENCDYLDYHYPELTAPFKYMPEGYEKWQAMYKAVKKFVPNQEVKKDMAKAEKNLQKPGSVSAAGPSTSGQGMGSAKLDEARKAANWERMQRTLKGLS